MRRKNLRKARLNAKGEAMIANRKRVCLLVASVCLLAGVIYAGAHRIWRLSECPEWEAWDRAVACSRVIPGQISIPLEMTEGDVTAAIYAASELQLCRDFSGSAAPVTAAETDRFSLIYPGAAYIELHIMPDGTIKGSLSDWDNHRRYTILNADGFSDFAEAAADRPCDSRYSEWEAFGPNAGCEIPADEMRRNSQREKDSLAKAVDKHRRRGI